MHFDWSDLLVNPASVDVDDSRTSGYNLLAEFASDFGEPFTVRSLLDDSLERLQFAGHETFPCRYGWLKKSYDAVVAGCGVNVFAPDTAIADFGVGKNMAVSMKHWALALGIVQVSGGDRSKAVSFSTTDLGDMLFATNDPYLEDMASLWLLHWRLVSSPGRSTTWYFAFNEFNEAYFTREILVARLIARLDDLRHSGRLPAGRITPATLARDADCLVRTYLPKGGGKADDGLECPFVELGLMASLPGGGAVQFRRGQKPTLPDEVFAHALVDFWQTRYGRRGSLSVETVTHEPGSPGRAFLMDEEAVAERLERIDKVTGGDLTWDEGAGIRQVSAKALVGTIPPLAVIERMFDRRAAA